MKDSQSALEELFPLPAGVRLRTRKFGVTPPTPLVTLSASGSNGTDTDSRAPIVRWEDSKLGLTVLLRQREAARRLVADAFCTDSAMLNKAWVSVALVGRHESNMIRKSIKLDQADGDGCRGSADFGSLKDAIEKLGAELGLVVFMSV